jgi:hypothetical protein
VVQRVSEEEVQPDGRLHHFAADVEHWLEQQAEAEPLSTRERMEGCGESVVASVVVK